MAIPPCYSQPIFVALPYPKKKENLHFFIEGHDTEGNTCFWGLEMIGNQDWLPCLTLTLWLPHQLIYTPLPPMTTLWNISIMIIAKIKNDLPLFSPTLLGLSLFAILHLELWPQAWNTKEPSQGHKIGTNTVVAHHEQLAWDLFLVPEVMISEMMSRASLAAVWQGHQNKNGQGRTPQNSYACYKYLP